MKKVFILIIILSCLFLSACSGNGIIEEGYNSYLCDVSNTEGVSSSEVDWISFKTFSDNSGMGLNKEVTFRGTTYHGKYLDSATSSFLTGNIHRFTCENNIDISFNDKNEFCNYHNRGLIFEDYFNKEDIFDEQQAYEYAEEIVSEYINTEEYSLKKEQSVIKHSSGKELVIYIYSNISSKLMILIQAIKL